MGRKRDTAPEPVVVTLRSPQDISVDVPGLVSFRCLGPRAFPHAAALFVDAELMADSIVLAGRSSRADAPVHSEGPNGWNRRAL